MVEHDVITSKDLLKELQRHVLECGKTNQELLQEVKKLPQAMTSLEKEMRDLRNEVHNFLQQSEEDHKKIDEKIGENRGNIEKLMENLEERKHWKKLIQERLVWVVSTLVLTGAAAMLWTGFVSEVTK